MTLLLISFALLLLVGLPIALAMLLSGVALAVALLITRLHIERPTAPAPAR